MQTESSLFLYFSAGALIGLSTILLKLNRTLANAPKLINEESIQRQPAHSTSLTLIIPAYNES